MPEIEAISIRLILLVAAPIAILSHLLGFEPFSPGFLGLVFLAWILYEKIEDWYLPTNPDLLSMPPEDGGA